MSIRKVFIAQSWSDISLNFQTTQLALKLSETKEVVFLTQSRIGHHAIRINPKLTVMEWPNKRPNSLRDFFFICKEI